VKGDHEFTRKPKGSKAGGYARPRVPIGFEPGMLKTIADRAKANNRSFAAEVRDLLKDGLRANRKSPFLATPAVSDALQGGQS